MRPIAPILAPILALALALPPAALAAVQPAPAVRLPLAAAVRPIEQLSAAERDHLPPSTQVKIGGITTTLGALRVAHQHAQARFAAINPAALRNANAAGLLPSKAVVEPPSGYKDGAADMLAFCNARQATVCLYYPANTPLFQGGGWASELDPYITDKTVCAAQNGVMLVSGCQYNYPTYYTANFVVGVAGFTSKVECDAAFWKVLAIDQHGAVAVQTTMPEGQPFTTGPKASTCVVYATLK